MRRATQCVAAALAGLALAAGCGGDDEEQDGDGLPPAIDTQRPDPEAPIGPEDEPRRPE